MKKINLVKTTKFFVLMFAASCFIQQAFCQQKIAGNLPAKNTGFSIESKGGQNLAPTIKDTVECMFHQVVSNNRPLLTWRKGYIVLEDKQIRLGDQLYPTMQASTLTGLIQNQFLASNKKKPVKKKVVQVVLLQ